MAEDRSTLRQQRASEIVTAGGDVNEQIRHQRRADLWLAIAMMAISTVVWWEASKLAPAPFDPLGPKSFPMWIAGALGLLSLAAVIVILCGKSLGRSETSMILGIGEEAPSDYTLRPGLAVAASLLTIAYVAVVTLTDLGFLWATIGYIFALGWAMSDRTKRHTVIAATTAVVAGVAIHLLFTKIFILDLP
jgi:hypothetical protein